MNVIIKVIKSEGCDDYEFTSKYPFTRCPFAVLFAQFVKIPIHFLCQERLTGDYLLPPEECLAPTPLP